MVNNKYEKQKIDTYKNYVDKLENEYLSTFEKIEVYINGSTKLNNLEKNNCFLEILDTFLSGQVEGKSVTDITGVNLKKYCDNMIYGETIYIYKASRICSTVICALFYVSFMHFFIGIFSAIRLKDSSIIFKPMNFGIGEIILILGYICIPKLLAVITRNYFENPVRCKKVKRYTDWVVWLFTIAIYTLMKETFNVYGIVLSFSSIVLILIYSAIVSFIISLLTGTVNNEKENKRKYFERLNKEYEKQKVKCGKRNKEHLDWHKFLKKKIKNNCIYTILFFVYGIIFLTFTILIGRGMLVKGNIDVEGIIILIVVSLLAVLMVGVVKDGINRNKQLAEME